MVKGMWNYALKVPDIEEAMEFYATCLGADLRIRSSVLGCEFSLIRVGDTRIILFDKAPYEDDMGWDLPVGFLHVVYEVEDFQETVAAVRASGVQIIMEPTLIEHEDFGKRWVCFFVSPDGIRTEVMEILEDAGKA